MASDLGKAEMRETRSPVVAESARTSHEEANGSEVSEVVGLRSKAGLLVGDAGLGWIWCFQLDTREC